MLSLICTITVSFNIYRIEANDESPENSDDLIKDTSSTVEGTL